MTGSRHGWKRRRKKMEDKKRFAILMAKLATAFENNGIMTDRVAFYWAYLKHIPMADLERAAEEIIHERKINCLPTIAEIEEKATRTGENELNRRALAAWRGANEMIITGARAGDEVLDESVRIAFGSWERFGGCNPEQDGYDRSHFTRVYKDVARRKAKEAPLLEADIRKQVEDNRRRLAEIEEEKPCPKKPG
jgi:hypothetical protein